MRCASACAPRRLPPTPAEQGAVVAEARSAFEQHRSLTDELPR